MHPITTSTAFTLLTLSTSILATAVPQLTQPPQIQLPTQNTSSSTACSDVHLIVVRASTEKPGQGVIGTLATKISSALPGSSVEWIQYPALLKPYDTSSAMGTAETTRRLQSYVDTCPKARVLLLGYSQGAHVVGDVMCGGGDGIGIGPATRPVAKKYQDRVVAMIQMGDPRHVPMKSFDVGSSVNIGIFPRPNNITCDPLASKIRSYCDKGDPFCDMGNNVTVHLTYTQRYNQDGFNFAMSKLKEANVAVQGTIGSLLSTNSGVGAAVHFSSLLSGIAIFTTVFVLLL